MGRLKTFRLTRHGREKMEELDRVLDQCYGAPEEKLENKQDPLEETVYIILSFQTDLDRSKQVWTELRQAFPSWYSLHTAPIRRVSRVLRLGGLQEQKAKTIKNLLKSVRSKNGEFSLSWLQDREDGEAERILTRLPGLSWKGARCVLLYSLERAVFPVDGNTVRILKRVGVLSSRSVYRRLGLHDGLQDAVEASRRKSFHINLVVHGQRICLPRRPLCSSCVARTICAMRGVPADIKRGARPRSFDESGVVTASQTEAPT